MWIGDICIDISYCFLVVLDVVCEVGCCMVCIFQMIFVLWSGKGLNFVLMFDLDLLNGFEGTRNLIDDDGMNADLLQICQSGNVVLTLFTGFIVSIDLSWVS